MLFDNENNYNNVNVYNARYRKQFTSTLPSDFQNAKIMACIELFLISNTFFVKFMNK